MSSRNVGDYYKLVDGIIVSSSLKKDGKLDYNLAKEFMEKINSIK